MSQMFIDPNRFVFDKERGLFVYSDKASDTDGNTILTDNIFDPHMAARRHGLDLPTSGEWGTIRKQMQQLDQDAGIEYYDEKNKERSFISEPIELTG